MPVSFTEEYRPLYFLSALGAGGMAVAFYMYLTFGVPHPGRPVATAPDILQALADGSPVTDAWILTVVAVVLLLALAHLVLLVANITAYRRFATTPAHAELVGSNAQVTLLAIPLTLAMSLNVAFVVAAMTVPGLWSVIEILFPLSMAGFVAIGAYALVQFERYVGRLLVHTGFDMDDSNHFNQILPSFAFIMIAVGFASAGAMSAVAATSVLGLLGFLFFAATSLIWAMVKIPVSFAAMLRSGMAPAAGPTLWMPIPILTLAAIGGLRLAAGASHTVAGQEIEPDLVAMPLLGLLMAQIAIGLFGAAIMRRQHYLADFVRGPKRSIASYGLICPGVAFSVLVMFAVHWGLVATGLVARGSVAHLAILALVLVVQGLTLWTMGTLNSKLLRWGWRTAQLPATA